GGGAGGGGGGVGEGGGGGEGGRPGRDGGCRGAGLGGGFAGPQLGAAEVAGGGHRQLTERLGAAGRGVGGQARLDVLLNLRRQLRGWRVARAQFHEDLDDLPAQRIRHSHGGRLGDRRIGEQRAFHLCRPNPVAGAVDHVICPTLKVEVAVH